MILIALILVVSLHEIDHASTPQTNNCVRTEVRSAGMVDVERCVEWHFGPKKFKELKQ